VDDYIVFPIKTSWKGYHRKWFYIQLHEECPIKGRGLMLMTNEKWTSIPTITEKM
jgi:hypothetical protein